MSRPPEPVLIHCTVNGNPVAAPVTASDRLLDLVRDHLGLTGAKDLCGEGECGACTVLLDGLPVASCLVPACQVRGRLVETVESVDPAVLVALARAGASQCGACTPGVVMTTTWIRRHPALAARFGIRELLAGNLCRCTGYDGIVEGIEASLPREDLA